MVENKTGKQNSQQKDKSVLKLGKSLNDLEQVT